MSYIVSFALAQSECLVKNFRDNRAQLGKHSPSKSNETLELKTTELNNSSRALFESNHEDLAFHFLSNAACVLLLLFLTSRWCITIRLLLARLLVRQFHRNMCPNLQNDQLVKL